MAGREQKLITPKRQEFLEGGGDPLLFPPAISPPLAYLSARQWLYLLIAFNGS